MLLRDGDQDRLKGGYECSIVCQKSGEIAVIVVMHITMLSFGVQTVFIYPAALVKKHFDQVIRLFALSHAESQA